MTETHVDKFRGALPEMSYPILDPARRNSALASKCALAVMAKAPRPGTVKTRLSPPLTAEQAAALNICFLKDSRGRRHQRCLRSRLLHARRRRKLV
jgi:hypothetical protein